MPLNTRVGRCVTKLKKKYGYGSAIGIFKRSTRQNYMKGKAMQKRRTRRKGRRSRRRRGGASCEACLEGHYYILKDMLIEHGLWGQKQSKGLSNVELSAGRIAIFNDFLKNGICAEDKMGCAYDTSIERMTDNEKIQLMDRIFLRVARGHGNKKAGARKNRKKKTRKCYT